MHAQAPAAPRRGARALLALAALLLAASLAPRAEVQAQAEDRTTLQIGLHGGTLGIRTIYAERPRVRVVDAQGIERVSLEAPGARPENGLWNVRLDLGAAGQPPYLLRPGDLVEVTIGGRVTSLEVPEMRATTQAEEDVVTGSVPPGVPAVALLLHRDEALYPGLADPEMQIVLAEPDGGFRAELGAVIDLAPGTWGEAAYESAEGHLIYTTFAVPWAQVSPEQYLVAFRSDAGLRPELALQDEGGFESHRSYQTVELGNGISYTQLTNDGTAAGIFVPEPGDYVAIDLGDGREVVEAVPDVRASVLRDPAELRGHAPAGSVTRIRLRATEGDPERAGALVVDESGRFTVPVTNLLLGRDAEATVAAWPGGAFDWVMPARVPFVEVPLQGHILEARLEGRGRVRVEHRPVDGPLTATVVDASPDGSLRATLQSRGVEARIAPGDELAFVPERGTEVVKRVPDLRVEVDVAQRRLTGAAPPGAELAARFYTEEVSIFGRELYEERPSVLVSGAADEQGRFALSCEDDGCGMGYGTLVAYDGDDRYVSYWLQRTIFGVAVSYAEILGKSTAGTAMTFTPFRPDGEALAPRYGVARPELLTGALPGWFIDLSEDFPEGLPVGARLEVSQDGAPSAELVVPAFDWEADVRRNRVRGSGPPLRTVFALALVPPGEIGRPATGVAQAVIGADGRYDMAFQGFDLRPGDDLELYVLMDEDYYLRWNEAGVEGEEPTPRPSQTARPTATPRPEPTATREPELSPLYLPLLQR